LRIQLENDMTKLDNLTGKHALVTGAARGIGPAIAQALLQYGAKVTIAARNFSKLEQAAKQLSAYGGVNFIELDVTESASVPAAFSQPLPVSVRLLS
jgi:NAD(P)-dependent dehydrogenase (short-subunit alcohol dehydrogenase family)